MITWWVYLHSLPVLFPLGRKFDIDIYMQGVE